jgi:hypothetical protein
MATKSRKPERTGLDAMMRDPKEGLRTPNATQKICSAQPDSSISIPGIGKKTPAPKIGVPFYEDKAAP